MANIMQRLDQLTFTRFMAVFLVLVYHGTAGIFIKPLNFFPISSLLHAAPTAVSYLYVLSGFVMSLVYYRPQEHFDVRGYWSARFVRIYPLYIIAFLLIFLYYGFPPIKAPKILANIFVIQAWFPNYAQSFNYPSWSLSVEFFFYTLFPFLTIWAYRRSTRLLIWLSIGFWMVSQTIYYFLWQRHFPEWEYFIVYFPLFHLNSFILGVVAGIWFFREAQTTRTASHANSLILLLCVLLVALYTIAGDVYPSLPHNLQPMAGLLSPLFAVIILTLALDKTRLSRALKHPWLMLLGETAFVLYVFEVPFVWFYERFLNNAAPVDSELILRSTALPIILLIGLSGHLYVDRPIRSWLKNLLKNVSMPVLIMDLALIALSVYLSFLIRFGVGKDLKEYISAAYSMFWLAFVLRTIFTLILKSSNPDIFLAPLSMTIRRTMLSVSVGSLLIAVSMWLLYRFGLIPGWPRSIFLLDWLFMLTLSLLSRYFLRASGALAAKAALV